MGHRFTERDLQPWIQWRDNEQIDTVCGVLLANVAPAPGERHWWGWYPETHTLVFGDGGYYVDNPIAMELLDFAAAWEHADETIAGSTDTTS